MRIIALGDFHGSFPKRRISDIKKLKPDLILCTGDLPKTDEMRKLLFRFWKERSEGVSLEELIGEKALQRLQSRAIKSIRPLLKILDSFGLPVVLIWGNADYVSERKERIHQLPLLNELVKEFSNITFVSRERSLDFGQVQILAFSGYRYLPEKGFGTEKLSKELKAKNSVWKRRLQRLFSHLDKKKTTIFLCHDPPKGTLDKVEWKESPMLGQHIGDELFSEQIIKSRPDFCVCGHIHEQQGKKRLKSTIVVNAGSMHQGNYAIINTKRNTAQKSISTVSLK